MYSTALTTLGPAGSDFAIIVVCGAGVGKLGALISVALGVAVMASSVMFWTAIWLITGMIVLAGGIVFSTFLTGFAGSGKALGSIITTVSFGVA
jgi:hypothetical protein